MVGNDIKSELKYFLIFSLISLILFGLDRIGGLKFLHTASDFINVPIQKQVFSFGQEFNFNNFFVNKNKLNDLEEEVNRLSSQTERIKVLEEENKSLRKQLETPLPPQWEYLDVKAIGESASLFIDKGKNAGLKINQIVLSSNLLVGKIKSISAFQSQVELPFNTSSKINVVTSSTDARGILIGQFGTKLFIENVLQEDKLNVGDMVLTAGDDIFPKGLLIGKITDVFKTESDLYQRAEVKPLLNYKNLKTIFVLIKR